MKFLHCNYFLKDRPNNFCKRKRVSLSDSSNCSTYHTETKYWKDRMKERGGNGGIGCPFECFENTGLDAILFMKPFERDYKR